MQIIKVTFQPDDFISQAVFRMNESLDWFNKCLDELLRDETWKNPNDS